MSPAKVVKRVVPEDHPYTHARMLKDYGSTASNPTGHIKALLTGNHCHFPIIDRKIVQGGAQEVYFCEFDGPSEQTLLIYPALTGSKTPTSRNE